MSVALNYAALGSSPFMHMPHVLETARAELLNAQAELHALRVKSGVGKIKKGGMLIQHATRRLYSALDAVKAAQELHS